MKNVILTPNPYRDTEFKSVLAAQKILHSYGVESKICLPFEVDKSYSLPKDIHFGRMDKELSNADAVICFGGDGTILHVAKAATRAGVPVMGVNNGNMGFIAELEAGEMDQLSRLATDDYRIDKRMMLDIVVHRGRDIVYHDICLNDAVITKGAVARIIHLNVKCDGVDAMNASGDGMIFSTPTGSTAYSLSAGGPIVEPEAHNILVTPICAHNLLSRTIVASDRRVITACLQKNSRRCAYLSSDGGKAFNLMSGDIVTVKKSHLETRLIRLNNRSFFDAVNSKFNITG